MERLIEGYRRFRSETWPASRKRYEILARRGQRPEALVIGCADSRIAIETLFDARPGELFVMRNVAGLVPPYQRDAGYHGTSAGIEFAVRVLQVSTVVVLGHTQCGGIQAIVKGAPPEAQDFVASWMGIAREAVEPLLRAGAGAEELDRYEAAVVKLSLDNLRTFPWIAELVAADLLSLHGCRLDIETGQLARLEGDRFVPVA